MNSERISLGGGRARGFYLEAVQPHYLHTMGSTYGPVFTDLLLINRYYGCECKFKIEIVKIVGRLSAKCPAGAVCKNEGFRHPRNCNKCICPNGFGGDDCSERQSGEGGAPANCGQTVTVGC